MSYASAPYSLCTWILNFLSEHPQVASLGSCLSSTITLSTGTPQGCVLRPIFDIRLCSCTHHSRWTPSLSFHMTQFLMIGDFWTAPMNQPTKWRCRTTEGFREQHVPEHSEDQASTLEGHRLMSTVQSSSVETQWRMESVHLQVTGYTHLREPHMVHLSRNDSNGYSFPEDDEISWSAPTDAGEHPNILHLYMVPQPYSS